MIDLKNVSAGYSSKPVIKDVNLHINNRGITGILGPNGSGKSTLLKSIIDNLPFRKGEISILNRSISDWDKRELAKIIAMIPQQTDFQFDHLVREYILMGRYPYLGFWGTYRKTDRERADEVIETLQLKPLQDKYLRHLSGGERQRVIIARALVQETQIILLDEAFSHLDVNYEIEIIKLISEIAESKKIVMISHNINLSAEFCDEIIFMKKGEIAFRGTPREVITSANLQKIYSTELHISENEITGNPQLLYINDKNA
ncbi:MAG: ABC transporter ATP-binding protein [Candidatus Cloacimonetes bacterium]|nr:ABC transporter ATP-binding protein [Candidatus Cloacimonadota bacterium]